MSDISYESFYLKKGSMILKESGYNYKKYSVQFPHSEIYIYIYISFGITDL